MILILGRQWSPLLAAATPAATTATAATAAVTAVAATILVEVAVLTTMGSLMAVVRRQFARPATALTLVLVQQLSAAVGSGRVS
jgi:hypothetical protein